MFENVTLIDLKTGEEVFKGKSINIESKVELEEIKPKKYKVEMKDEEGNTYTASTDKLEVDGKNLYTDFAVFKDIKLKSVDTIKGE